jgi:hypothetical protein
MELVTPGTEGLDLFVILGFGLNNCAITERSSEWRTALIFFALVDADGKDAEE